MSWLKLGFGKIQNRLKAVAGNKKFQPALFIAAFAVVGSAFVLFSQAATPVTSFQAEAGTRSGDVTTVVDATASAGSAVKFGTGGGSIPVITDFPTPESVGPATEPTQVYIGDCYFDASESGQVIDGKIVDCEEEGVRFAENTQGIVFRNSVIRGGMATMGSDAANENDARPIVYTVEDSRIIQTLSGGEYNWQDRGTCCSHYVVKRSLIQGTHSGLLAHNQVTLEGNYITTDGTHSHQSGLRMLKNSILRGNTILCKPTNTNPDAGCSAAGVFYRERIDGTNAAAYNLTIESNYFMRDPAGGPYYATRFIDCASWTDCVDIKFTGNLFSLGWGTDAGEFPVYANNEWTNNYWTDGVPALLNSGR